MSAYSLLKRVIDIVVSIIALPVFLVILAIMAILIKLEDGGPIFYNADRMGQHGVPFKMHKFRSMKVDAPDIRSDDGSTFNSPDDPRQTRIGAFMRRTSIDETPQILDVLMGRMSIVGPRPDDLIESQLYTPEEARRLDVPPGITGYAQAYGRNSLPRKERLALDVHYVENRSLALDARIFLKTLASVFTQEGVYTESGAVLSDEDEKPGK